MKKSYPIRIKLLLINLLLVAIVFILTYCFVQQLTIIKKTSVDALASVLDEGDSLQRVRLNLFEFNTVLSRYLKQPAQLNKEQVDEALKALQYSLENIYRAPVFNGFEELPELRSAEKIQTLFSDIVSLYQVANELKVEVIEGHLRHLVVLVQGLVEKTPGGFTDAPAVSVELIKASQALESNFQWLLNHPMGLDALANLRQIVSNMKTLGASQLTDSDGRDFQRAIEALTGSLAQLNNRQQRALKLQNRQTQLYLELQSKTSAMLNLVDDKVTDYKLLDKENLIAAKIVAWSLGALAIVLIGLCAVYLSKLLITSLDELVEIAQLFAGAKFKELLSTHKKQPYKVLARTDELAIVAQVFVDQSRYQQRMIFDIDTSCQGVILGFLTQHTSFDYQGDYRLIEHTLNSAKDHLHAFNQDITGICQSVSQGKLEVVKKPALYLGDFAALQAATDALLLQQECQIGDIVKVTQSIQAGLQDKQGFVEPNYTYAGDNQAIQQSLEHAIKYLRESAQYNIDQNWLKSGLSDLNKHMTGEQPLEVLTKNSIDFIANYFDAPIGYIYRSIDSDNAEKSIKLISHYGILMDTQAQQTRYKFTYPAGVGLIGQVFIKPEIIVKELAQDERLAISQSGIAKAKLNYVAVIPLIHEERIEGVLELGLYAPLSKIQHEFLLQVVNNLGIAMNVAVSRDQMNDLLAQSQRQAEELAIQQSKLGQSNEMLLLKAHELEEKQQAVEEQNRQLEQASFVMEERAKELSLASKYKSEFLANMSHELRSPLNSLLILAKLLIDNRKQHLDATEVNYAQVIYRSGTDLMQLIEDILDLSKIEAGKTDIHYAQVPLATMVKHVSQRFSQTALEKDLEFSHSIEKAPEVVDVDEKRVTQIITNLLSNAFKFTEQGHIHLSVESCAKGSIIQDSSAQAKNLGYAALCICIQDTGIGIAEDHRERIFQAFQQADGTTSRKYGGTGLGLTITRHLVGLMGGEIHFQSELEKGTTFCVYLPLRALAQDAEEPADTAEILQNIATTEIAAPPVAIVNRQDSTVEQASVVYVMSAQAYSDRVEESVRKYAFKLLMTSDIDEGLSFAEQHMPQGIIIDQPLSESQQQLAQQQLESNLRTRDIQVYWLPQCFGLAEGECTVILAADQSQLIALLANRLDIIQGERLTEITLCSQNTEFIDDFNDYYSKPMVLASAELTLSQIQQLEPVAEQQPGGILVIDIQDSEAFDLLQLVNQNSQYQAFDIIVLALTALAQERLKEVQWLLKDTLLVCNQADHLQAVDGFLASLNQKSSSDQKLLMQDYFIQSNALENKRVLIVDDNISNVFALAAILEMHNVEYLVADNGLQALDVLDKAAKVDLILMDIMMPELDGYQTMEQIRLLPKYQETPIIALTAKAMPEDRGKCISAGANDYMTKPIETDKLISLLNMWLVTMPEDVQFTETI